MTHSDFPIQNGDIDQHTDLKKWWSIIIHEYWATWESQTRRGAK